MDRPFRRAGARRRRGDAAAVRRSVRRDRLADVRADAPAVRRARRPDRARRAQPDAVLLRFGRDLGGARRPARLRARRRGGDAGAAVLRRAVAARRLRPVARRRPVARARRPVEIQRRPAGARNRRLRRARPAASGLWFARPAPYLAALVALAIVAPVVVWNARHGWVSFAFQGARAEAAGALAAGRRSGRWRSARSPFCRPGSPRRWSPR